MKKIVAAVLALLIVFSFASCIKTKPEESPDEITTTDISQPENGNVIKIGVFDSSDTNYALGLKQYLLGIKYANKVFPEIEIAEEKYKIKLEIVFAGSDVQTARSQAQKLADSSVSAVIGSFDNNLLSSVCDIFEKANIPVICPYGCSIQVQEAYNNVFSFCSDDYDQAVKCANYAYNSIMSRNVLVLSHLGDNTSQSQAYYFKEAFEALGGKATVKAFEDEIDINSKTADYNMIYAPVTQYYASKIISECEASQLSLSVLGGSLCDNEITLEKGGKRSFPVYTYSYLTTNSNSEFYKDFSAFISSDKDNEISNGGNNSVATSCVLSFDAYMLAVNAIIEANSYDAGSLLNAIKQMDFNGESGYISFDETGKNKLTPSCLKKADSYYNIWKQVG